MINETKIDILRVKDALSILKPNGQLFEVRILKGKTIISGYFTNVDVLEKRIGIIVDVLILEMISKAIKVQFPFIS